MKKALLILPLIALSGCDLFDPPLTRQEVLTIYRNQCMDYGFEWGTPEMAECVKDLEYKDEKMALERRKVQALEDQTRLNRGQSGNLRPRNFPQF